MQVLCTYDWPGNVRELENVIQQMVAMNSGPLLHRYDLPSQLQNFELRAADHPIALAAAAAGAVPQSGPTEQPVQNFAGSPVVPMFELEKRAIMGALQYTKGDRSLAATLLAIGRTTLYRKLKEYAIEDELADLSLK